MGLLSSGDYREYVPQPKEDLINLRVKYSSEEDGYDSYERNELAEWKVLDETSKSRHMITFFYVMGVMNLIAGVIYAFSLVF